MPAHRHVRKEILLFVGWSGTAVLLGAGISVLSGRDLFRVLAIVPAAVAVLVLAGFSAPAAIAKTRSLAARLSWWHGLWLLMLLSGLVFRWRTVEAIEDTPVDFWAGWRIGLTGVVALVLLSRLATRAGDWGAALLRGLPAGLLLYGFTSLVSTLWSVYPTWTLYKSVEYLIDLALLAAAVTAVRRIDEIKSLFDWTWLLYGLLMASVWLGVLLRPDEAVETAPGPIGIQILGIWPFISSNGVGDIGAILLIVAATRLLSRQQHRSFYWLAFFAALPTLILAQSRSPFTGALLGLLAVFWLQKRYGMLTVAAVVSGTLLTFTAAEAIFQQAFMRGQSTDMFYSLSGRMDYWTLAWDVFRDHPFVGLGGYAAGRFGVLASLGTSAASTSSLHNTWLEILVGVGLMGFLPVLATVFGTWLSILRPVYHASASSAVRELRVESIGLLVLLCFRSIFTVEFIWHPPIIFFVVLAYAELLRRARLEASAASPVPALWRRKHGLHFRGALPASSSHS